MQSMRVFKRKRAAGVFIEIDPRTGRIEKIYIAGQNDDEVRLTAPARNKGTEIHQVAGNKT